MEKGKEDMQKNNVENKQIIPKKQANEGPQNGGGR